MSSLCLQQLRELTINNGVATLSSPSPTHLLIGSSSFPRHLRTPYKSAKNEYFELDSLWFLLTHRSLPLSEYLTKCKENDIKPIPFAERKGILDFITGVTASSNRIDIAGLEQMEANEQEMRKRKAADSSTTSGDHMSDDTKKEEGDEDRAKRLKSSASHSSFSSPYSSLISFDDSSILSREIPLSTRSSVLQCNKNFSSLGTIFDTIQHEIVKQREMKQKEEREQKTLPPTAASAASSSAKKSSSSSSSSSPHSHRRPSDSHSLHLSIPIIVVPSAVSSLITLLNVTDFLSNGTFISSASKRESGAKKSEIISLRRPSFYDRNKTVEWHIIDDITKLKSDEDWNRLSAVFVSGQSWQFDGWPKKLFPTPQDIFENVPAFHLHWDDEPLKGNVAAWRLQRLAISKTKRYQDRGVVTEFWSKTTEIIAAKNAKKKLNI